MQEKLKKRKEEPKQTPEKKSKEKNTQNADYFLRGRIVCGKNRFVRIVGKDCTYWACFGNCPGCEHFIIMEDDLLREVGRKLGGKFLLKEFLKRVQRVEVKEGVVDVVWKVGD